VYVAGTAVLILSLPADDLRGDETPIATAAETFGVWGAVPLIVIAALAAFASTANAGVMSASRYPLALARDGIVWARFARLNSAGTPVWAVVVSGAAIALIVSVIDVEGIAKLGSAFVLVSFGMMNASVIILRRARVPDYRPSFRVPGHPWVPAIGLLTSIVLIVDLGPLPALSALALAGGSAAWYRWVSRNQPARAGALVWQHRRGRLHIEADMLAELQEQGPITDDWAPEALTGTAARRIRAPSDLASVRRAASSALAGTMSVHEQEAHRWLDSPRHPVICLEGGDAEVHLINVDAPAELTVIVAWAPADDREDARLAGGMMSAEVRRRQWWSGPRPPATATLVWPPCWPRNWPRTASPNAGHTTPTTWESYSPRTPPVVAALIRRGTDAGSREAGSCGYGIGRLAGLIRGSPGYR
jgi:hypothetical protein